MKHINPTQVTTAITAAGNLIAKDLSDDEVNFLAAAFMQLADVLATIGVVRELNAGSDAPSDTSQNSQDSTREQQSSSAKS